MKRFLIVMMFITLIFFGRSIEISALSPSLSLNESAATDESFDISDFRNSTYIRTWKNWLKTYDYVDMAEITLTLDSFIPINQDIDILTDQGYEQQMTANLEKGDKLNVQFNAPSTGLYEIGIDFYMPEVFYTIPTIEVLINDEAQYNELKELELEVLWEVVPLTEELRYNRYGNELLPKSQSLNAWQKTYLSDFYSLTSGNYQFLLSEGLNTISLRALNLPVTIGNVYLKGKEELIGYSDYKELFKDQTSDSNDLITTIQGESFILKNDLEIKSSYYKESAMTPYTYRHTVLNQLDGGSMSRGGTLVTYSFEVEKSGFYNIDFKALHNQNLGVAAGKNIYLDGEIPFEELNGYLFESSRKWENITLGNNDGAFEFYLTAGTHHLSIESTVHQYQDYIDELNMIMDNISSISLLVKTITGGNNSDTVDWDILKYIPDLVERLNNYADRLEAIYEEIDLLDEGVSSAGEVSTLNVAAKQMRRIAKNPNKIGSKLPEFSEGSGSAYQLIGNGISYLMSQALSIDCIYIYNNVELPKPTGSIFRKIWDGFRSFIYSFFDTRYNNSDVDDETLEVWVGQSSLYLDIIQSMIDQDFTATTGIKVKGSIMNNVQKIVLSNATNDNPDVVLAIDNWNPYAYALRGILTDLREFEDFGEVSKNYYANNFTTLIFEDGVYGIPETQSTFLLYYRKDILEYLDLEVPDTWDDVINMLPILQSHQMNFYHPLGGDSSFKGYGFTTPFIYQFGGEIYTENGISSTLREEPTIEAIRFMTELFTIYNLPLQVSSFFEHFRSGDMPIGISSIDLYLQMKYAAPELSGQWDAVVLPGVFNEETNTVERWTPSYGKASIIFSNSEMQEEAWELIKWWNSTETQIAYMQNIKTGLGEKYLFLTANMNALEQSVWDESIKATVMEQAKWARIPAVTPGSYVVERELSNIWNKVVIDQDNVLVAINESVPKILRELSRKADEFGYISQNNPDGIMYYVPMNSNINRWIEEEYDDAD